MSPLVIEGRVLSVGDDEDGDLCVTVDAGEFEHVIPVPREEAAAWAGLIGRDVRLTTAVEVLR